jgi:hypothetical protein
VGKPLVGGTRFLQCALGYPNERWSSTPSGPTLVWPPNRGRGVRGLVGAVEDSLEGCHVG